MRSRPVRAATAPGAAAERARTRNGVVPRAPAQSDTGGPPAPGAPGHPARVRPDTASRQAFAGPDAAVREARARPAPAPSREGTHPRALRRDTVARLVYLRARDADARLRELEAHRARLRPALGALARALVERRAHEALGFRNLGDFARERLGVGARALREWARVWRALEELPRLRRAVLEGEVAWTVARKVVAVAGPDTDAACVDTVRGRTVRAVEALVRAVREAAGSAEASADPTDGDDEERVRVALPCSGVVTGKWALAVELARRVAGESLPVWEAAEAIAAEAIAATGAAPEVSGAAGMRAADALEGGPCRAEPSGRHPAGRGGRSAGEGGGEHGLRAVVWPHLPWRPGPAAAEGDGNGPVGRLLRGLERCTPRELDRRLRAALRLFQRLDFEIGRVLRQVVDRRLYRDLGFDTFERFVVERLDLSPRTARRLVRLARAEHRRPAVATAFRTGRLTLLQAEALLRAEDGARAPDGRGAVGRSGGADAPGLRVSVAFARRVTLRRLDDEVGVAGRGAIAFRAPPDVARLFLGMADRVGLEPMLDHAIATWTQAGRQFRDYADFERDGYRCTVPGCTARRNLHSHHIVFRSAGGPDEPWNRTTLCAQHHERGVHGAGAGGRIRIRGRAPDRLVYDLGVGRFVSGDIRVPRGSGASALSTGR